MNITKTGSRIMQLMQHNIVIATTDGRAYYEFVTLLKKLSIAHRDLLPSEAKGLRGNFILTTKREFSSITPERFLLYEEMNGDFEHDAIALLSRLFPSRNDLLVLGVDPGGVTGIAVLYRGYPISFRSFSDYSEAVEFIERMLMLNVQKCILRIGKADARGRRMAEHLSMIASAIQRNAESSRISIEMVDERGTSKREEKRREGKLYNSFHGPAYRTDNAVLQTIQRDALAALNIAKRKGIPLAPLT